MFPSLCSYVWCVECATRCGGWRQIRSRLQGVRAWRRIPCWMKDDNVEERPAREHTAQEENKKRKRHPIARDTRLRAANAAEQMTNRPERQKNEARWQKRGRVPRGAMRRSATRPGAEDGPSGSRLKSPGLHPTGASCQPVPGRRHSTQS